MSNYKPFAFVLMPFSAGFSDIYQLGIKQVAEENGVVAERVDEQHFSETILERVYRQIENSDFIIAEMTGMNPNVFYEVGYAHAKGKICALVTQSASDIPFDLKQHPHVIYDGSIMDLTRISHRTFRGGPDRLNEGPDRAAARRQRCGQARLRAALRRVRCRGWLVAVRGFRGGCGSAA